MTLQYRSDTGALLKLATGELMNECCCLIPCNSCEPALSKTYQITISGAGQDLSWANGVWTVQWRWGCVWSTSSNPAEGYVINFLYYGWTTSPDVWRVTIRNTPNVEIYSTYACGWSVAQEFSFPCEPTSWPGRPYGYWPVSSDAGCDEGNGNKPSISVA